MPSLEGRLKLAAALGLGLVLAVVVAAAGIRLGTGYPGLRVVHRIAASLEVVVVLWLGWMAWRARGAQPRVFRVALIALALTAILSVIGIAAGQQPPPAAAATNLLGGLTLSVCFAWILGIFDRSAHFALALPVAMLLAIQVSLGAWLSIVDRVHMALPLHGISAIALAAALSWIALARIGGALGKGLFALALAAPLAGFSALHADHSAGAALVHAAAAALLVVSTAYALSRGA